MRGITEALGGRNGGALRNTCTIILRRLMIDTVITALIRHQEGERNCLAR
jgi:hypothetical protein